MSSDFNLSEKTQNTECDSGFVSCASCVSDTCSMKVAKSSPTSNDYVKDLQSDFSEINDFDAVQTNTVGPSAASKLSCTGTENNKLMQQQQESFFTQLSQYFEQNDDGDTQLHVAVFMEYSRIALWLIDNAPCQSLLDIQNDDCLTALQVAVMTKQHRIVRKLVLAGADTTVRTSKVYKPCTSKGNAAIHMACEAVDLESVKALTEPLSQEEQYWLACNQRVPPVLGRDLELRNYDGITPMHTAITKGNLEIVKELIKVGAQVNTIDPRSGFTSLHLAINNRRRDIVEYMAREYKHCINVPTRYGAYSYEIALNVDKQLAEDLLRWGAAPVIRESDSESSCDSDSDESVDDGSENYSSSVSSCAEMYQGPIALIST